MHLLDKGLTWSTLAYIVFVCLAAAASIILAFFVGRVEAAKDAELKRLQDTSAAALAQAHAGAARAAAQAAMALQEQRRLEGDLAQVQADRDRLKRENLELQIALDKTRAERPPLEPRAAPRHIAATQRHAIQAALASFRGQKVAIITHPGDPEIAAFASQIRATLQAAGMVVSLTPALIFGHTQPGIGLDVGSHRRQLATALAKAFIDAGVTSGPITAMESDDADLLEITVGPKP